MTPHVHYFPKEARATYAAAQALRRAVLQARKRPVLLLVSGGSSLCLLDFIKVPAGVDVTVGLIDERVSERSADRNVTGLKKSRLYKASIASGRAHFIDPTPKRGESAARAAGRVARGYGAWLKEHPGGAVIGTLGIGADGHSAGIFPMPKNRSRFNRLFRGNRLFLSYHVPKRLNPHTHRQTSTITMLEKLDYALVFALGDEKKEALQGILKRSGSLAATPARVIKRIRTAHIYTNIRTDR